LRLACIWNALQRLKSDCTPAQECLVAKTLKTDITSKDFHELAATRKTTYSFLVSVYIQLSTDNLASKLMDGTLATAPSSSAMTHQTAKDIEEGFQILGQYVADNRGRPVEVVAEELAVERTRLFRGLKRGYGPPPPYETVYRDTERTMPMRTIAVSKLYEEVGANLSKELKEQPDYIGVELDSMRLMCEREAEAWGTGKVEDAKRMLQLERKLLNEHLAAWIPKFCDTALNDARTGFYKAVLKITKGVVLSEAALIGDLIETAESIG
jgi:TorA maturation chaperone TorD